MMPSAARSVYGFMLAVFCGCVLLLPVPAAATTETEWRFRVFLDEREIGHHHFHLTRNGADIELKTEADFKVSFLRLPVFRYRHENAEVWQNRCLSSITSTTDENGRQFRVDGVANGGKFRLSTHEGTQTLPACVSTFAYWDKSFLERDRLLNSQTGEYVDVEVRYLGEETIRVRTEQMPAHRYLLTADKADIEIWYSEDGRWLALQSTTSGGRLLRYAMD